MGCLQAWDCILKSWVYYRPWTIHNKRGSTLPLAMENPLQMTLQPNGGFLEEFPKHHWWSMVTIVIYSYTAQYWGIHGMLPVGMARSAQVFCLLFFWMLQATRWKLPGFSWTKTLTECFSKLLDTPSCFFWRCPNLRCPQSSLCQVVRFFLVRTDIRQLENRMDRLQTSLSDPLDVGCHWCHRQFFGARGQTCRNLEVRCCNRNFQESAMFPAIKTTDAPKSLEF